MYYGVNLKNYNELVNEIETILDCMNKTRLKQN